MIDDRRRCEVECLHHLKNSTKLMCCFCGRQFEDIDPTKTVSFAYRIGFDHVPSGPYYPTILAANR